MAPARRPKEKATARTAWLRAMRPAMRMGPTMMERVTGRWLSIT